jgi:ergothioneine biosynthesis protein EgtB
MSLLERYKKIRLHTEHLCKDLQPEDTVAQAADFVSPPKWHLAHSTWFFETFVLKPSQPNYQEFNPSFHILFNSYYESLGIGLQRSKRGLISRPLILEVLEYRSYVDDQMSALLQNPLEEKLEATITLGLEHEQQHQELLVTDTKYLFAQNPIFPKWSPDLFYSFKEQTSQIEWLPILAGLRNIGCEGDGFCFDNELGVHQQYINDFLIANRPVTNGEYIEFINAGGYTDFSFWLSDGWAWVKNTKQKAPLYWTKKDGDWWTFGFKGLEKINQALPAIHINYYEADAFARWKGKRLPTEFEHETAAKLFPEHFEPAVWEWTQSAYLPYPGFKIASGAVGEYNGKFMVNQMVLKGASIATPQNHSRPSYRNFFSPDLQWQFSGIRLVNDL